MHKARQGRSGQVNGGGDAPFSDDDLAARACSKVLIIDDDPALLRLMAMAFKAAGFSTVAAENGRKGIRMAGALKPDLVVTDIVMPDIEGIGAIRAIKDAARPPKVIAISGAGRGRGADYLSWARHLGADAVLAKPFRMSELLNISQSVISSNPNP